MTPLLAVAAPECQVNAARRFLQSIRRIGPRFAGQHRALASALAHLEPGGLEADHAIVLAVAVADHVLFDEMRPTFDHSDAWSDDAAQYQRFFAYESFVPAAVRRVLSERHPGFQHVLIGVPEHVSALEPRSGAGLLTPDLAYWVDSSKPLPPCCVPRQALYSSLLRCGIDPLADVASTPRTRPREGAWPRHVRRSGRLLSRLARGLPDVDAVLQRSARHWGALMAEERPCDAILMSSGSAANESVILSLSRSTRGLAFVDPGFYFENFKSISERRFAGRVAGDVGLATTFFVCLEPITFCHPLGEGAHRRSVLPLLRDVAQLARSAPERVYHLVLDVTADPTMQVGAVLGSPLPANLVVYKTCSISKHQDGSRNYLAGAVTVSTTDDTRRRELEADLLDARTQVGGDLWPIHALNVPRTTRRSIEVKRARIVALNRAVARELDPAREGRVVPYTYHSFLLPSRDVVKRLASETLALALSGGLRARLDFERQARVYLQERDRSLADALDEVEYGNSFGLPRTRLMSQNCSALDVCPGLRMSMCVYRLCPGYEADQRRVVAEARHALETIEETFLQLIAMARALRERIVQEWILHG